jgi:hypothetical protein
LILPISNLDHPTIVRTDVPDSVVVTVARVAAVYTVDGAHYMEVLRHKPTRLRLQTAPYL